MVNYAASAGAAEEVASKIKEMGSDALIVKANVGKREEIDAMFKEVTEKWGRVDVLVNNAGRCYIGRRGGGEIEAVGASAVGSSWGRPS